MFLLCLLILFGISFSIPAILIEKEVVTKSKFSESYRKVKLYRAEGYEKEVWEEKTTTKGTPFGQLNKGEKITHFKEGKAIAYTVNHQNRTYVKREIEGKMLLMGLMIVLDCDQQGKCKPKLEPTDERKKVGKWTARKIIVKVNMFGRMVPMYHWYTKDSRLLIESDRLGMKNVFKAVGSDPKASSFLRGAAKALEKVERDYVPKDFFNVPKGYRELKSQMPTMPPHNYDMYRQR